MATSSLHSLSCPNCGAPLEFAEGQTKLRCGFCGSRIERSDEALTDDDLAQVLQVHLVNGQISSTQSSSARHFVIKMQNNQPVVIAVDVKTPSVQAAPIRRPSRSRSGGCALVVGILFIVLTVGLPISLALFNVKQVAQVIRAVFSGNLDEARTAASTVNRRILVRSAGALIPSSSDGQPDLVVMTSQYSLNGDGYEQRLVALGSSEPKMLWQSEALDRDVWNVPIQAEDDLVFTLTGTQLLAISRVDGQTVWSATLADQVELNLCVDCFRAHEGRVFALSDDGTLQAYNARTGALLWSYRAEQDSPRGLYLLAGRPAFMDRVDIKGVLRVFDPATGQMQTVQPACASGTDADRPEYADWTTPLYLSPDEASFYVLFDDSVLCVQRRDSQTLDEAWSTPFAARTSYDAAILIAPDRVYLSSKSTLASIATADGQLEILHSDPDYDLAPLAVSGDTLIVRAKRTRGSEQWALWGIGAGASVATADGPLWTFDLGDSRPLDKWSGIISDGKSVWMVRPIATGLAVLRVEAAEDDVSHAIQLDTLNVQTGAVESTQRVKLGIKTIILSSPAVFGWRGDTMWMSIESQVIGLDVAAAEIIYRWP
ncbi:MAG: PQQ-binding-like beta-propeller repeat protein [Anaerolineae bacterium]|nr:PQQ-binding-like beta-propeller repeat protein [Anaerolineae bacterium]